MNKATNFLNSIRRRRFSFLQMSSSSTSSDRYSFKPVLRWNPQVEDYFIKAYGADRFARISNALTRPSCYSCIRVNTLRTTADDVIEKLRGIMREREGERARALNESDGLASKDVKESSGEVLDISKCEFPGLDYVVFVKGTGPHEIDYGNENGRPPKEVLVSRKCAEAVLRGAQVYVPGVMACSAHVEVGDTVAVSVAVEQPLSDGSWGRGITRGTILQGTPSDPFYSERNGLYIGQGITKLSRAGIFRVLQGIAIDMDNCIYKLPSFYDVLEGDIFLQNLPSIIAAHAVDPQRGERILDMCAAPGGKTTAIAMLMKDEGEVVAADRSHNKVSDLQNLAAEMGLSCIVTYKLDALKSVCQSNISNGESSSNSSADKISNSSSFCTKKISSIDVDGSSGNKAIKENASNEKAYKATHDGKDGIRKNTRRLKNGTGRSHCQGERVEKSKGFNPDSFDRVLLDAPCSALGLRPRLFAGEETITSLRNHAKYQKKMFDQAVQLVRPGGVLVYSTCTINPGENEALVRYALDTYKFLSLAPQHPRIGGPGLIGQCEFPDGYIEEWLRPGEEELVQRFDPSSSLDTIGFFIAKFHVGSKDV